MTHSPTVCHCPEPHPRKAWVGPHEHVTVTAADLKVGDRLVVQEVTGEPQPEWPAPGWVSVPVVYDGGAVGTIEQPASFRLCVIRPLREGETIAH